MSLFGSNSTFGSNNQYQQSQAQPTTSLFGSAPAQPQQQSSLFGSNTNTNNQSSGSGGLFGRVGATNAPSTGGLFGSANPAPSGGGLFNNNNQTSAPAASGGLFANTTNNNANQPSGGSSLFGGSTLNNNNSTGGSLFGGNSTQQQNKPMLSLFGASTNQPQQQQQNQPQNSLFGNTTNNAQAQTEPNWGSTTTARPSLLPSLSLGQSTTSIPSASQNNPQQQTIPGVRIDISALRGTTRFSDLHEDLASQITTIDAFIAQQVAYSGQIAALMPSHAQNLSTLGPDVEYIRSRIEAVESALDNDGVNIKEMKGVVSSDAEDARRSFRAVENLKLPQQFHYLPGWQNGGANGAGSRAVALSNDGADRESSSMDLMGYFDRTASEMQETLNVYTERLAEIERHMRSVEASAVAQGQTVLFKRQRSADDQVRELANVLREFEGGILGVAGKVGSVREGVSEVINANAGRR